MSIVRLAMEVHGGQIRIESDLAGQEMHDMLYIAFGLYMDSNI
jgi:hypothetical protein